MLGITDDLQLLITLRLRKATAALTQKSVLITLMELHQLLLRQIITPLPRRYWKRVIPVADSVNSAILKWRIPVYPFKVYFIFSCLIFISGCLMNMVAEFPRSCFAHASRVCVWGFAKDYSPSLESLESIANCFLVQPTVVRTNTHSSCAQEKQQSWVSFTLY